MKKLFTVTCAVAAVAAPQVANAASHHSRQHARAHNDAVDTCKGLRKAAGKANFRALEHSNHHAFARCVATETQENVREARQARQDAHQNAVDQCRSERQSDPQAFQDTYGTNGKDGHNGQHRNAFGKCVSQHARANRQQENQQNAQEDQNQVNAAQQCRDEQSQDPDAFRDNYGTNHNKRNAFGKCVSQKARAMNQQDEQQEGGEQQS